MTTLDCILEYNFGKILFFYTYDQTLGLLAWAVVFLLKCKEPLPSSNIFLIYEMQIALKCSKIYPIAKHKTICPGMSYKKNQTQSNNVQDARWPL